MIFLFRQVQTTIGIKRMGSTILVSFAYRRDVDIVGDRWSRTSLRLSYDLVQETGCHGMLVLEQCSS